MGMVHSVYKKTYIYIYVCMNVYVKMGGLHKNSNRIKNHNKQNIIISHSLCLKHASYSLLDALHVQTFPKIPNFEILVY